MLLYSIAAAAVLISAFFGGGLWTPVGYDRGAPRAMFDRLPDYAKRATWAHQNSFETFTIYAAAALMAYATGTDATAAAVAAVVFVGARLLYSVFYILNVPLGRSLMFARGQVCTITLIVLSLLIVSS